MYDLTNERSLDSQGKWFIDVLGLFSDMLSMGVCTTRHWQTSGRLVQELNVCTVTFVRALSGIKRIFFSVFFVH